VSINVSGHKYGLVYPGVGWVVWRAPEFLPKELVFNINYLGADQASFTLNFSRGASQIIGQYYQMIRLGKRGYRAIMLNLTRTADYLAANLEQIGMIILSKKGGEGLPLVAFKLKEGKLYDEFQLAHSLRERGWVVPAYTMAPHSEELKLMRVVVREDFSKSRCDALICDIKFAVEQLDKMDEKKVKEHTEYVSSKFQEFKRLSMLKIVFSRHVQRMVVNNWQTGTRKRMGSVAHYNDEDHSLQGKHGKTHAVC
jgi:glutamate decarboxylase